METKDTFFDSKIELDKKHENAINASYANSSTFRYGSFLKGDTNTLYGVSRELVDCLKKWNDYIDGKEFEDLAKKQDIIKACENLKYPFKLAGKEKDWFNKQDDTGKVNIGIFEGVVGTFNGLFSGTKSAEQKKFAKAIRNHIKDLGVVEKNIDKYKETHNDKGHSTQCSFFNYVLGILEKTVKLLTDLEAWYK